MNINTAIPIANWFLASIDRDAGESLTHLKLQKLVYYAQAWALARLNHPLFQEDLEAWTHGPVAPSVYEKFKDYGWEALPYPDEVLEFDAPVETLLQEVLEVYGGLSAKHLETLTHHEAPWREARGELPEEMSSKSPISPESMTRYYTYLFEKLNEKSSLSNDDRQG